MKALLLIVLIFSSSIVMARPVSCDHAMDLQEVAEKNLDLVESMALNGTTARVMSELYNQWLDSVDQVTLSCGYSKKDRFRFSKGDKV